MDERFESGPLSSTGPGPGSAGGNSERGDRQSYGETGQEARGAVRGTRQRLADAYDRTSHAAQRAYHEASDYAREHPGVAALVTLSAGVLIGMLVTGGDRSRGYRGRVLPALATAMAEAVLDIFDGQR